MSYPQLFRRGRKRMAIFRKLFTTVLFCILAVSVCACQAEPVVIVVTATQGPTATKFVTYTPKPLPTFTSTPQVVNMTILANVNCRKGPSTNYEVLASVSANTVVRAMGRAADNGWWYVENPDNAFSGCWIRQDFAAADGDVNVLPVFTPGPEPTATWAPVATNPPVEPTAGCTVNDKITIINSTNDWITLNLSGPGAFHFRLPTGKSVIEVCAGTYSYTGYGCGGDSLNGEMKSGTKVEFYCD
jgi:hypothetical protein